MNPIPGQTNTRTLDVIARADGSPITAGTVNYYLVAKTGANAGKWFKHSDQTWNVAETVCIAMTHRADGHWYADSVHADAWADGIEYEEYAKESGDLHVPLGDDFRCESLAFTDPSGRIDAAISSRAATGAEMDLVDAPNATAVTAIQNGLSTFDGTGATLHGDYDAAKTAAQAGDAMTLADDAITAAKFDESTAYPVASADTGATQIARVGADSDTLETLSDQMDAITTDTNELQTDWTDGGRLDLILDALIPSAAVNIDHDSTVIIQEDG